MDIMQVLIDFVLHIDKHIAEIFTNYQQLSYGILFLIIFIETGLVIMPFLPGDSLLFATGALIATTQTLNIFIFIPLIIIAAITGDNVNYFVGKYLGDKVLENKWVGKIVNPTHIERVEKYFESFGSRTVVIARFIPIVRTITPFVAGVGEMKYSSFLKYSLFGAIVWVTGLTSLGYFFGNFEFVKNHFEYVVFAIIGISILPMIYHYIKSKF